jgi:hypothetical protein
VGFIKGRKFLDQMSDYLSASQEDIFPTELLIFNSASPEHVVARLEVFTAVNIRGLLGFNAV